eukprot:4603094-Amphidinium_carterae.1
MNSAKERRLWKPKSSNKWTDCVSVCPKFVIWLALHNSAFPVLHVLLGLGVLRTSSRHLPALGLYCRKRGAYTVHHAMIVAGSASALISTVAWQMCCDRPQGLLQDPHPWQLWLDSRSLHNSLENS